jgi:hypothetical protein
MASWWTSDEALPEPERALGLATPTPEPPGRPRPACPRRHARRHASPMPWHSRGTRREDAAPKSRAGARDLFDDSLQRRVIAR